MYLDYIDVGAPDMPEYKRDIHDVYDVGWMPSERDGFRLLTLKAQSSSEILAAKEVEIGALESDTTFRLTDPYGYGGVEVCVCQ